MVRPAHHDKVIAEGLDSRADYDKGAMRYPSHSGLAEECNGGAPRLTMTRILVLKLALLVGVVGPAACTKAQLGSGVARHAWTIPGTLRWGDGEDIDNLNPMLSTETLVNDLSSFTMGYFFKFDNKNNPVPDLCLEVPTQANHDISEDGKAITFKLRRNVLWHDGKPFTSSDVAFTVKTILDPRTNVSTRHGWDQIDHLTTPDKHTVIFHLKQPFAPFMNVFFTPVGNPAILPAHILAGQDVNHARYNSLPVGLGPFKYVRWSRGNEVVMDAFDRWWGGKPKLRRIVFKVIPDTNTLFTQLQTHEVDAYVRVANTHWQRVVRTPDTRTATYDTTTYGHVDFNLDNPALHDVLVRRALASAIDKALLWDKVDHQSGHVDWTPVSHLNWAYDANAPRYPFNLQRAAALLDEAGWKPGTDGLRHKAGRTLRLTFVGNTGNSGLDARVLLIQGWYKQIGVALEYLRYPTNKLFASYAGGGVVANRKYDLASYAWSLTPDPDPTNQIACSAISPKGLNYMAYCNPQVDRLLQDAVLHYDRARRRRDLIAVQQLLGNDEPFVVLTQRTDHLTYNDNFTGIRPGPSMIFWNPQSISN